MKCPKCENIEGLVASNTHSHARGYTEYQLKCLCGHEWIDRKGGRFLTAEKRRALQVKWSNVKYVDPIRDSLLKRHGLE